MSYLPKDSMLTFNKYAGKGMLIMKDNFRLCNLSFVNDSHRDACRLRLSPDGSKHSLRSTFKFTCMSSADLCITILINNIIINIKQ